MMLAELAAFYRAKGMTLIDAMEELYKKYGYYREGLTALTFKGRDGAEKISRIMTDMREHPAETLGGNRMLAVRDYKSGAPYASCVERALL